MESGAGIAWRVFYRSAPGYDAILEDLAGKWVFDSAVHYLSDDHKGLPVFQPPVEAAATDAAISP